MNKTKPTRKVVIVKSSSWSAGLVFTTAGEYLHIDRLCGHTAFTKLLVPGAIVLLEPNRYMASLDMQLWTPIPMEEQQ